MAGTQISETSHRSAHRNTVSQHHIISYHSRGEGGVEVVGDGEGGKVVTGR
jgi:hypothetical protein